MARNTKPYTYMPAPRSNRKGSIDGGWIIRDPGGTLIYHLPNRARCFAWAKRKGVRLLAERRRRKKRVAVAS